jgi:hypothetical protein
MSEPAFLYSRSQYEAAVASFTDGGSPAPECLRWKLASRRDRGRYDRVASAWSTMSLEDKVGHIAMLIGHYVRGEADNMRHVITYGYEMLCRRGALSDR